MAGLCTPLPTLRLRPHGRRRTARGRCGSLFLHRNGLAPSTPCRSPGALRVKSGHKPKLGSVREGLPCGTVASVVPVREILANGRADFRQIRNVTQPCGLPRAMRGALSSRQGFPTLFARRPRRSRRWDSDACKLDRLGRSLPQHSHRPQGSLHRLPFSDRAEDRRPGRHGRSRFRGSSHTG